MGIAAVVLMEHPFCMAQKSRLFEKRGIAAAERVRRGNSACGHAKIAPEHDSHGLYCAIRLFRLTVTRLSEQNVQLGP